MFFVLFGCCFGVVVRCVMRGEGGGVVDRVVVVTVCPWCGKRNDCHNGTRGQEVPFAGALSVCAGCRHASVFVEVDGLLELRKPGVEERAEIIRSQDFWDALKFSRERFGKAWMKPL